MCVCSIFTTRILQGPLKNRVILDFNQHYSKNLFISISFIVDLSGPYSLGMEIYNNNNNNNNSNSQR